MAVFQVCGSSMEPALSAGDLVLAEACDVAGLRPGDLVVMKSRQGNEGHGGSGAAPVVHRLVETRQGHDGFRLRTQGDNRMTDDGIWSQDDVLGRVARVWRRSSAGYSSLRMDPRCNRWHAALARAEGRAWGAMRAMKWRILGARSLAAAPLLAHMFHELIRSGHGLLQATVLGGGTEMRGPS